MSTLTEKPTLAETLDRVDRDGLRVFWVVEGADVLDTALSLMVRRLPATPDGSRVRRSLGRECYESASGGWLRLVRDTHTHSVRGYVCDLLVVDVAAHAKAARLMERDLMGLVVGGAEVWMPTPTPTLADLLRRSAVLHDFKGEADWSEIELGRGYVSCECGEDFEHEDMGHAHNAWHEHVVSAQAAVAAEWLESPEARGAVEHAILGRGTIAAAKAAVAALAAEAAKGAGE